MAKRPPSRPAKKRARRPRPKKSPPPGHRFGVLTIPPGVRIINWTIVADELREDRYNGEYE